MDAKIDGKWNYTIMIPYDCDKRIEFASKELRFFLLKCTNIDFNVCREAKDIVGSVISLGETNKYLSKYDKLDISKFTADGFVIKTDGKDVYINGATSNGTLYGVYDFLERFFKVRFISSDTTITPKTSNLDIDKIDIESIPDFALRGYLETSTYHGYEDQDYAVRKRFNHTFIRLDEEHGESCPVWGRNDTHNFHFYVSPEKYGNPKDEKNYHPEFFWKEDDGEVFQLDDFIGKKAVTICLTNGLTDDGKFDDAKEISVLKVALEELKKDVIANPKVTYFVFEQEDGDVKCKCEKCLEAERKYKRSGMLIRFCNVLADELQKWANETLNGRTIKIVTFGYIYSAEPPVQEVDGKYVPIDETVIPNDNLVMRLAFGRNCIYSYFDERQIPSTLSNLKKWKGLGKRFFAWTYDAFFDRYLLFMPSIHTICDDVVNFKKYGIEYFMAQGAYNTYGLWQDVMKAYIYSVVLWDVTQDVDELKSEFLLHYFGAIGARYVQDFIDEYYAFYTAKLKAKPDTLVKTFGMGGEDAFSKEILTKTIRIVDEARQKTKESSLDDSLKRLYDKHLAQVKLNSVFPLCEHFKHFFPEKSEKDYLVFAKDFVALCEYAGVTRYHEMFDIKSFVEAGYKFPY